MIDDFSILWNLKLTHELYNTLNYRQNEQKNTHLHLHKSDAISGSLLIHYARVFCVSLCAQNAVSPYNGHNIN